MNLYFDSEFTGLHQNTTLISLGIVAEDGRSFYAQFSDYDKNQVDSWLEENVIANLLSFPGQFPDEFNEQSCQLVFGSKQGCVEVLREWLTKFYNITMISDCLAYDWMLFNNLFGTAFDLPSNISYIPIDICTMFYCANIDPDISREKFIADHGVSVVGNKHNALYDAKVIKECYNILKTKIKSI